jgi:hypothetical protein
VTNCKPRKIFRSLEKTFSSTVQILRWLKNRFISLFILFLFIFYYYMCFSCSCSSPLYIALPLSSSSSFPPYSSSYSSSSLLHFLLLFLLSLASPLSTYFFFFFSFYSHLLSSSTSSTLPPPLFLHISSSLSFPLCSLPSYSSLSFIFYPPTPSFLQSIFIPSFSNPSYTIEYSGWAEDEVTANPAVECVLIVCSYAWRHGHAWVF